MTTSATPLPADADFDTRLQSFVGRADGPISETVVDQTVVVRLLEAVGDRNPLYSDPSVAASTIHRRVVVPVTALMSWTVSAKPRPRHGVDSSGRRVFRLEGAPAGSASSQSDDGTAVQSDQWGAAVEMREFLKAEGYIAPAVTNGWFEYRRYLVAGESLSVTAVRIDEIVGPKKTGLGIGYFITTSQQVLDAQGEVVAVIRQRMLRARPFAAESKATPRAADSSASAETAVAPVDATDDWSFRNAPWAPSATPIAEGDALPELIVDLTPTQIVAGAIASQDWAPVHHDAGYASAVGHPNVFMNIQTSTAFVGRFITDWAGPGAAIEALDIRLGVPSYAGDIMSMSGEVVSVEPLNERNRVTVAVTATNRLGVHINSTVTLTVPSSEHAEPRYGESP